MGVFVSVLSAVVFSTAGVVYPSSIVDEVRCVLNTQHIDTRQAVFDISRYPPQRLSDDPKVRIIRYALAMRCIYERISALSLCNESNNRCACDDEFGWDVVLSCGEGKLYETCCDYCGGASDDGDVLCEEIIRIARSCPQIYSAADPLAPFCGTAGS
jgi:hypothetical protein